MPPNYYKALGPIKSLTIPLKLRKTRNSLGGCPREGGTERKRRDKPVRQRRPWAVNFHCATSVKPHKDWGTGHYRVHFTVQDMEAPRFMEPIQTPGKLIKSRFKCKDYMTQKPTFSIAMCYLSITREQKLKGEEKGICNMEQTHASLETNHSNKNV